MNQSQGIQEVLKFKSRFADDDDLTPAFRKKLASMERKVWSDKDIQNLFGLSVRAKADHGIFVWRGDGRYKRADALKVFLATGDDKAEKKADKEARKRFDIDGENVVARTIPT